MTCNTHTSCFLIHLTFIRPNEFSSSILLSFGRMKPDHIFHHLHLLLIRPNESSHSFSFSLYLFCFVVFCLCVCDVYALYVLFMRVYLNFCCVSTSCNFLFISQVLKGEHNFILLNTLINDLDPPFRSNKLVI